MARFDSEPKPATRRVAGRAWLPLIWVLGTGTAVLVGWSAVQVVVDQVVREQPGPLNALAVNGLGASPVASPSAEQQLQTPSPVSKQSPAPSQPVSSTPTPAASGGAPPAAPAKLSRTFNLQGGTVDVSCQNNQISLVWATPNAGFQVETEWHQSNTVLEVRFNGSSHESRLQTWCSAGQIQSSIEEQAS